MGRHATFDVSDLDRFAALVNNTENRITYLSIDPGKWNGACGYDSDFHLQFMYVVAADDMIQFLSAFQHVEKCIYESYRLFPNKMRQQVYSDMETPRVIGRIESWAQLSKVETIKQDPGIKITGYAWIGEKPPTKSSNKNDPMDAHVHFMYWAVRQGKIDAADLLQKPK